MADNLDAVLDNKYSQCQRTPILAVIWLVCVSDIVIIRAALRQDVDAVTEIEAGALKTDWHGREDLDRRISDGDVLVAELNKTIVGYCAIIFRKGRAAAMLDTIAVVPTAIGKGVGKALLNAAAKEARRRGHGTLRLLVRSDNERAIGFYQQFGFRRSCRSKPIFYSDGMAAIRMHKRIVGPLRALSLALRDIARHFRRKTGPV